MEFISRFFPFTVDEVTIAFRAQGLSQAEAKQAAASFEAHFASLDENDAARVVEFGPWLDSIAATSTEAAYRVAEFRKLSPPSSTRLAFERRED